VRFENTGEQLHQTLLFCVAEGRDGFIQDRKGGKSHADRGMIESLVVK